MGLLDLLRGKKKEPDGGKKTGDKPGTTTPLKKDLKGMSFEEGQKALKPHWQPGTMYRDERVDPLHSKEGAASGNVNQVDLLAYEGIKLGSASKGFFKESKSGEEVGSAAEDIGIDKDDPRLDARSVATSRVAEMSGLGNVIAKTSYAQHKGKMGTVSEAAPGRAILDAKDMEITDPGAIKTLEAEPAYNFGDEKGLTPDGFPVSYRKDPTTGKIYKKKGTIELRAHDFKNPRTQKEMNDLQWVDAITGQVDRHAGNIFIDPATGAVKGIDNDAAFGSKESSDPGDFSHKKLKASHFEGMPTLVDSGTAERLLALDEADFKKRLEPLLSPPEVEAAISRLRAVKTRILFLRQSGKEVGGGPLQTYGGWGDETFDEQSKSDSSYLGTAVRNRADAEAFEKKHGKRADLEIETPEQMASWKPKEMPLQVPKELEKAVKDMPGLLSPGFDRHRGGKEKAPTDKAPVLSGGHRKQKVSEPPKKKPPEPPKPSTPPVPSLASKKPTLPKPPPGVTVSKPPDFVTKDKPPSRPPPKAPPKTPVTGVKSRAQMFEALAVQQKPPSPEDLRKKN